MAMSTIEARALANAEQRQRRRNLTPGRIGAWVVLVLFLLLTIVPFLWMIRTAFSTTRSLPSNPTSLLPVDFTWGAFQRVLGLGTQAQAIAEGGSGASVNFWLYLRNSRSTPERSPGRSSSARWPTRSPGSVARPRARVRALPARCWCPRSSEPSQLIPIKNLGLLKTLLGMILPAF
jgi:multiple sugar transport system permease protein